MFGFFCGNIRRTLSEMVRNEKLPELLEIMVAPSLLYTCGCETWTQSRPHKNRSSKDAIL
jgi:hypothetical protein